MHTPKSISENFQATRAILSLSFARKMFIFNPRKWQAPLLLGRTHAYYVSIHTSRMSASPVGFLLAYRKAFPIDKYLKKFPFLSFRLEELSCASNVLTVIAHVHCVPIYEYSHTSAQTNWILWTFYNFYNYRYKSCTWCARSSDTCVHELAYELVQSKSAPTLACAHK